MFQFLNPIYLFAISAIVIPVIIHLWNIRKGKILKVGSISLITTASDQRARSFRLRDILILILRCILIILFTFLLAEPVWTKITITDSIKGWILIPPDEINEAYTNFKHPIDSLRSSGYELRLFQPGFRTAELSDSTNEKQSLPYWSLITLFEKVYGNSIPIAIFTSDNLNRFKGKRPSLTNRNITWHFYTSRDSLSKTLQYAYSLKSDSIRLMNTVSKPSSTRFIHRDIASIGPSNKDFTISVENGILFVENKTGTNDKPARVFPDTAISITVYNDRKHGQHLYLIAALEAIADVTGRNIRTTLIRDTNSLPLKQDWLFWLSTDPVSDTAKASNIFLYATGNVENKQSNLYIRQPHYISDGNIRLYRSIWKTDSLTHSPDKIWEDGTGNPMLERDGNVYRFYSRLSPTWTDLVWHQEFPEIILQLILNDRLKFDDGNDKRVIDNTQGMVAVSQTGKFAGRIHPPTYPLKNFILLMIILLLFTERYLSYNSRRRDGRIRG